MIQEWFEVLTWPSNSPDLNPIEGLWDVLDKDVCSMKAPPQSLQDCCWCSYHSTASGLFWQEKGTNAISNSCL